MKILNQNDIHLRFLLGLPVHVEGIGNFYSPLLKDIVQITESKYNMYLSSLLFERSMLNVESEEIKHLTDMQILNSIMYQDASYREVFFYTLKLHFNKFPKFHEKGFIYFDEVNENTILTDEKFDYIKTLVRIANNLQEEEKEEYNFGNDKARQFYEQQQKKKARLAKYKKPKINLHSIISAVGWKSKAFDFISELNIYQLYNGYSRYQMIDNYNQTMSGIYGGTVDGSKIKIEDINWANIFNTK